MEQLRIFARVVETGSFTRTAAEMGQTQPSISRQVAALEERYQARLLERSTRSVRPTEDGQMVYEHAQKLFDAAADVEASLIARGRDIRGKVRIAASIVFGRLELLPRLGRFMDLYPGIELDLALTDRFVDLIEDGVDIAIRIGAVEQAGLIVRNIGSMRRIVVAHRDYWQKTGIPRHPSELSSRDCLIYTGLHEQGSWTFKNAEATMNVPIHGRLTMSTSDALREAVLLGMGPSITPSWFFRKELATGEVVEVLQDFQTEPRRVQVVMPSKRLLAPRVRAFSDFLANELRGDAHLG
ncbi:LysR family transcriptional regulator [Sphingorhabdus lacus]|uniref:LysR family transcriptional regulator n=1 Tax=Sphingorhabdus lacus TaxID=392610 RepID=UPI0035939EAC